MSDVRKKVRMILKSLLSGADGGTGNEAVVKAVLGLRDEAERRELLGVHLAERNPDTFAALFAAAQPDDLAALGKGLLDEFGEAAVKAALAECKAAKDGEAVADTFAALLKSDAEKRGAFAAALVKADKGEEDEEEDEEDDDEKDKKPFGRGSKKRGKSDLPPVPPTDAIVKRLDFERFDEWSGANTTQMAALVAHVGTLAKAVEDLVNENAALRKSLADVLEPVGTAVLAIDAVRAQVEAMKKNIDEIPAASRTGPWPYYPAASPAGEPRRKEPDSKMEKGALVTDPGVMKAAINRLPPDERVRAEAFWEQTGGYLPKDDRLKVTDNGRGEDSPAGAGR